MDLPTKRPSSGANMPSSPPTSWKPSDGHDVVIANPWGPSSFGPVRPPSPSMLYPLPILISPTCPQHGLLIQECDQSKTTFGRCSALLDGLPPDSTTIRMAFTLGLCKLFCGIVIFLLGVAAIPLQATLAGIGMGLWAGMVTLVSGVAGLLSSRLPRNYAILVAFLCWSITSLVTSALLVIFAATGLNKDLAHPAYSETVSVFDTPSHDEVLANSSLAILSAAMESGKDTVQSSKRAATGSDGDSMIFYVLFRTGRPAIVVNVALVILAVVDCLVSIMSITLASSETCSCCMGSGEDGGGEGVWGGSRAERKDRQDRLLRWIQQQRLRLIMQPPPEAFGNFGCYTPSRPLSRMAVTGPESFLSTVRSRSSLGRSFHSGATVNSAISADSLVKSPAEVTLPAPPHAEDGLTRKQSSSNRLESEKSSPDDVIIDASLPGPVNMDEK